MIKIFFYVPRQYGGVSRIGCLVGQNRTNHGNRRGTTVLLRVRKLKTESVEVLTVNDRKEI